MSQKRPQNAKKNPGKDTNLSIKHRSDGNAKYQQKEFFEALEFYNKSLMHSLSESAEIPLAYANRSAVYLEVEEFQLCLDNIQLAIDSGYPVEKMQTLKDREEKCKMMMETEVKSDDDDPWNFFKLSYPANEKVPFIAGCLELRKDEKFGRYIVTNRDLKPGDIVGVEDPFFYSYQPEGEHLRCTNCLKSNKMSLIPNDVFCSVMFCSKDCMEKAEDVYLKAEEALYYTEFNQRILLRALAICGGSFANLQQMIDDPELSNKTVFDFDLSNPEDPNYMYHLLAAFNGLQMRPLTNDDMEIMESHPVLKLLRSKEEKEAAKSFMLRSKRIIVQNSFRLDWMKPKMSADNKFLETSNETVYIGAGVFLFGSLFSHSCAPNIDRILVDNKVIFSIRRPVAKGQQLFISYGPTFTLEKIQRQKSLLDLFQFLCSCEACRGNYPLPTGVGFAGIPLAHNLSIAEYKKTFEKNCKELANNRKHPADAEMWMLMDLNDVLRAAIGKNEPFIF